MLKLSILILVLFAAASVKAGESMIVEETGEACLADDNKPDKTEKQTESEARNEAKRAAAERVATRIKSTASSDIVEIKNEGKADAFKVAQVLQSAYVNADVRELAELERKWFANGDRGRCIRIHLRVEVVPKSEPLEGIGAALQEDPTLPLNVRLWTNRSKAGERATYRNGDNIRLYLRGNKPFYARVIYKMVDGQMLQVLPNRHRNNHYFQGGTTYVIPSGDDGFQLEVQAPFGLEKVQVYASERPLGDWNLQPAGDIYLVDAKSVDVLAAQARGVKLVVKNNAKAGETTEFSESFVELITTP
jgi:hypothetical protein